MQLEIAVVKIVGVVACFQKVFAAQLPNVDSLSSFSTEEHDDPSQKMAPIALSTLGSPDRLLSNPNQALMDAAPLTFQTLQQMHTLGLDGHHAVPGVQADIAEASATSHSQQVRRPKAALVAESDTFEKPRRPRQHSMDAGSEMLGLPSRSQRSFEAAEDMTPKSRRPRHSRSLVSVGRSSDGTTATLDEAGYQAVAASRDSRAMWFFIRRVVQEENADVFDEGMFNGLVPYYSGEKDVQTFARLKEELFHSGTQTGMIRKSRSHRKPLASSMEADMEEVYERTHKL